MALQDLRKHLRFIVKNASSEDCSSKFMEVVDAINRAADTVDMESLLTMCPLLLDSMRTGLCPDKQIAHRLALVCARYLKHISHWGYQDGDYSAFRSFSKDVRNMMNSEDVSYVLAPAHFRHLDTWDSDEDFRGSGSVEDSVAFALYAGSWKYLTVLLQYGFWNGSIDKSGYDDFFRFWEYLQTRNRSRPSIRNFVLRSEANYLWSCLEESGGKISNGGERISDGGGRGFRRIRLILWALRAVTVLKTKHQDAYLRCLGLYFAAVPDPFVSQDEVRDFLMYLLRNDSDRPFVNQLVDQFGKVFGRHAFGPRTLKHLCRCVVKTRLVAMVANSNVALPKLVKDLNIPETLKDFLMGAPE